MHAHKVVQTLEEQNEEVYVNVWSVELTSLHRDVTSSGKDSQFSQEHPIHLYSITKGALHQRRS